MKDMSQIGGGMNFYGELPDSYNLVVNQNHPLISEISGEMDSAGGEQLQALGNEIKKLSEEVSFLEKEHSSKKSEEISQAEKDDLEKLRKELDDVKGKRNEILEKFGFEHKKVRQLIDLALLANNMLRGEELSNFVNRSIGLL